MYEGFDVTCVEYDRSRILLERFFTPLELFKGSFFCLRSDRPALDATKCNLIRAGYFVKFKYDINVFEQNWPIIRR